jgi:hypothetical protein
MWLACLPKTSLIGLAPHWFDAPASWFRPTSRFSSRRHPFLRTKVTFRRLSPTSEYDPSIHGAHPQRRRTYFLEAFLPPQRNPCIESNRSWAFPAQVPLRPHTYHVSRRLTPSTHSLVSFQPGALTGRHPPELHLTEIARRLSAGASPLAISEPTAVGRR